MYSLLFITSSSVLDSGNEGLTVSFGFYAQRTVNALGMSDVKRKKKSGIVRAKINLVMVLPGVIIIKNNFKLNPNIFCHSRHKRHPLDVIRFPNRKISFHMR